MQALGIAKSGVRPRETVHAIVHLDPQLRIITWEAGASRALGWRSDEAVGEPWLELIGSDSGRKRRLRRFREGQLPSPGELVTLVGKYRPVRVPVRVTAGGPAASPAFYRIEFVAALRILPQIAPFSALASQRVSLPGGGAAVVACPIVATLTDNAIGDRLRKAREKAGLSKQALARLAGVTHHQIRTWEIGLHKPTADSIDRLIPHIGGTVDYYLFGRKP